MYVRNEWNEQKQAIIKIKKTLSQLQNFLPAFLCSCQQSYYEHTSISSRST
ncbi:hypothetical protein D932_03132, partial [Enterococcus casseliflavus 14-MB-W-14]